MSEPGSMTDDKHAALEEENSNLRQEILNLRQFIDSMQNLIEAVETAPSEAQIMDLLDQILTNARATINAKDGSLLVLDEDTSELVFVLSQGEVPREHLHWRRLPPGQGIAAWVVEHRCATIVNATQGDERFYGGIDDELQFNTNSVLAAPLIGGGRVLGVIELLNKHDEKLFSMGDQTLLSLLCRFVGELLYNMIRKNNESLPGTG